MHVLIHRKLKGYTIASAQEFEIVVQVIAQLDIQKVMSYKTNPGKNMWTLIPSVREAFLKELDSVNLQLFGSDLLNLLPKNPDITETVALQ